MWQRILEDITGGRHEQALIRLWLWAEGTENSSQRLSVWRGRFVRADHDRMVVAVLASLDKSPILVGAEAEKHPLALIDALDRFEGGKGDFQASRGGLVRIEEGGVGYWLLRRMPKPALPADRQDPNLERWFRHFRVLPDHITIGEASMSVDLVVVADPQCESSEAHSGVRVTHFADEAKTDFSESVESESFWANRVDGAEARFTSLENELEAIARERLRLWVAPELTVSPELRQRTQARLADRPLGHLLVAVPGSFHELVQGRKVNRAMIFDGDGAFLAEHEKLTQFSYCRQPGGPTLCESIIAQRKFTLLATSIGLVGIAICKDYSDETAGGMIQAAWNRLAPDWLLVPSMGDESTLKLHKQCAQSHLKTRGTRTVVANQQAFSAQPQPGFVCSDAGVQEANPGGSTHSLPT